MKLTFVFVILGVLYFVSWVIQLASGGQENAQQRRARLQARSEAMRRQAQHGGGPAARPQSGQRAQPGMRPPSGRQPSQREVEVLRTLERTLGLPEGSVAPPQAPPPPPTPPPAPRVVARAQPEDHGGDLRQRHLGKGDERMAHMAHLAPSTIGTSGRIGGLSQQKRLRSSFEKESVAPKLQRKLNLNEHLANLNPLQRAIMLSEVLQPPVARRRGHRRI